MRIAIDARYLCEPFGSMTVYCGNLLRTLVELDLGAAPVALVPGDLDPSAQLLHEQLGDRVRWVRPAEKLDRLSGLAAELRWVHREVPSLLARQVPDADALIMTYHHPPVRTPGVHRVAVVHDLCGLGVGFPRHKKAYWRHYLRLRAAAHLADAIWPISRSTRDDMARRFPSSRRRMGPVIYNGVDRRVAQRGDVDRVLATHGLERGSYVVAFATWQERKNFAASLAALTVLRQRGNALRLVGIAPRGEIDGIRTWCAEEGHDDAVLLTGIEDSDLDALYQGALALVWPSICEGFGYPVVEAMLQGCPPLVADTGPGAELVHGAIRPLASLAGQSIADRLDDLRAISPADRAALEERLRIRAAEFSPQAYRLQLREALRSLERSPAAPSDDRAA